MAPLEGPVGIGALVDAVMLGCVVVQSCVYYKNSRDDTWLLKVLVSLILLLSLSQLGCVAAWLCARAQVDAAGDASVPDYATMLFGVSSVLGAAILFLERCYFAHYIQTTSNNHLLTFAFFIFCIFSLTAATGPASVFFTHATTDLTNQLRSSWTFPLVIIFGLVYDLAVSITTAFYLRHQAETQVEDALGRATCLFVWVAETSLMTSLIDVVTVFVYWLTKTNLAWVGLLIVMPGVFANALLAALNARGHRQCADIKHGRTLKIGEKLIDESVKRAPIMITISKKTEKKIEQSPV